MPITVVCPACKARLKAPDNLIGKMVKCPGCTKAVVVKAMAPAPPPAPAVKKPMKQPAPPVVEEEPLDDLEDELDEPAPKKKKKRVEEEPLDDLEDELDEPTPKKKKKKRVAEDNDEGVAAPGGPTTDKERGTAMWIHLMPIVLGWCCGIGSWISLFMWLSKRKESAFIDHHGKAWLNWVINLFVVGFAFGIVAGVLQTVGGLTGSGTVAMITSGLVGLLGLSFGVAILVMQIMVALKAKKGEWAEYRVLFKVLK